MSVILVILLFLGWQPAAKNDRGNELYQQERYDEALAAYNEALAEDGENPALHYNRGNALYRSEQYPSAVQAYTKALDGEAPVGGRAQYNMGNSLFRMGLLEESIEAYKAGLRVEPDDIDMKYNLEYVMRQLKQQEEQARRDAQDPPRDPEDQPDPPDQADPDDPDDPDDGGPEPEEEESPEAPPPREGELSRAEAERLLNALNRDEQDIQRRLRRQQATQVNPEKDW